MAMIRWYDYTVIMPLAWLMSQSFIKGNLFFGILTYCVFVAYSIKRKKLESKDI